MKSITIRNPDEPYEIVEKAQEELAASYSDILERPIHDTGSKFYSIASFFLPPIGLIAGLIFKKFKHIRNFKACKKGAIAGLCTIGAVIALFGLALLAAVI